MAWWRTTWTYDGDELTVASGVWNRTVRRVPVARLQQVEVVRKLRHQLFGVATVRLQLAHDGDGGDVVLEVLSVADADRLRNGLERRRRAVSFGDDAVAHVPAPPAHELLRLGPRLLALGGLTGASLLLVPTGMVALLSTLDDLGLGDDAEDLAGRLPAVGGAVIAVLLAVAAAPTLMVVRFHGFRLARRTTDLVLERGVFERRSSTVPLARLQLVRLHRNLVRRWLHLGSVDLATSGRATAEGTGSADDAVPVARWHDVLAVAEVALAPRRLVVADRRAVPAATRRLVRRRTLVAVVLTGWVPFVWAPATVGVGAFVALVIVVARAAGRARRHGIGAELVVVETGLIVWTRTFVPLDRVQSWRITESPFQRRAGLRHGVDPPGGHVGSSHRACRRRVVGAARCAARGDRAASVRLNAAGAPARLGVEIHR
ncbi:MAG: PH domain-containing protein [Ilumatobacteraceae bacterium]